MSESLYRRNLAVPFYTQRDNTYVWQQLYDKDEYNSKNILIKQKNQPFGPKYPMAWRTCNITSLCMILHYWGLTEETPNQIIEKAFSKTGDGWNWLYEVTEEREDKTKTGAARLEDWSNLKKIAMLYIEGKEGYTVVQGEKKLSMDLLQTQIAKGIPVMISTGLGSPFGSGDKDGHIVVVRGFTDKEDLILNDPFGVPVDNENKIRQSGTSSNIYGYYYLSGAASTGDNIIINRKDFLSRYAADTTKYLYIEGPLWQEPGGIESDVTNSYPIRADNMWHDGIHLESKDGFYSIGCGRLLAARNAEVENHGSSSFALVKYQLPSVDNQFFYALYMHLKKIDLAEELSDFFLKNNGNVSEQIKGTWYEQIFNNLLPRYKILNLSIPKSIDEGTDFNRIYKAKLDGYSLVPTTEPSPLFSDAGLLSRHFKLYLLPVKPELLKSISDISNYGNFRSLKFMLDKNESKNENNFMDSKGYYYFFCGNSGKRELCCCKNDSFKKEDEGSYDTFASYNIFNGSNYKYYTQKLKDLYDGNTVVFNKINTGTEITGDKRMKNMKFPYNSILDTEPYQNWNSELTLHSKTNNDSTTIKNCFERIRCELNEFTSYLEYLFSIFAECSGSEQKKKVKDTYEKYFADYRTRRVNLLSDLLAKLTFYSGNPDVAEDENALSDKEWMKILFQDAETKLNFKEILNCTGSYDVNKDYEDLRNAFIDNINVYINYGLTDVISICEFLMIEFIGIPQKMLKNAIEDRFIFNKNGKTSETIKSLQTVWNNCFDDLSTIYGSVFNVTYIDNYVEVPRGAKIGYGSDIPDSGKKDSIHFEIFSKESLLADITTIEETDDDNFYNAYEISKSLLGGIKLTEEEKNKLLKYADDNVITKKEIQDIYKTTNIFQELETHHKSEWVNRKYSQDDISSITASSVNKTTTDHTVNRKDKKEIIKALDYFNDYYNKYNWIEKNGKIEKELDGNVFYFYHPLYLLKRFSEL